MPSITSLLDHYGPLAVFLFVVVENFGVPIPGETMLIVAAAYAASGHTSIALVVVCCIAGVWTGATLSYLAGRSGGVALMTRLRVPERHLARAEGYMTRWGGYTVLFGRYVAFLRSYIGWLAGINKMRPLPFYLWNLAGAVAWTLTFGALGYLLGNNWGLIEKKLGAGVVVVVAVGVVLYVAYEVYKRRRDARIEAVSEQARRATRVGAGGPALGGEQATEEALAAGDKLA